MDSIKCFNCGAWNSQESAFCQVCRQKLLTGQEYAEKLQELKEYKEFRRRYSILGIILALLLLLLLYPVVKWGIQLLFPAQGTAALPAVILEYAAPAIILLIFLVAVLPKILGRWEMRRRYCWTSEKMRILNSQIRFLPLDFSGTNAQTGVNTNSAMQKVHGPPTILLVIVFTLVGLVYINAYTDFKPLDTIISFFNTDIVGTAQVVDGRYECHYDGEDLGGGVMQTDQTWAYVFYSDGSYTTYLEGYQQYSGTWSQTGNKLTVYVPAIAGISEEYYFEATVSNNGDSFVCGDSEFVKVAEN